jgi:hypothetical protein
VFHPLMAEKGMTMMRLQRLHLSSNPCPPTLAISWPHSQRVSPQSAEWLLEGVALTIMSAISGQMKLRTIINILNDRRKSRPFMLLNGSAFVLALPYYSASTNSGFSLNQFRFFVFRAGGRNTPRDARPKTYNPRWGTNPRRWRLCQRASSFGSGGEPLGQMLIVNSEGLSASLTTRCAPSGDGGPAFLDQ